MYKRDACFSCDVLARLIKHQSYSQGEVSATMENAIPVKADSDLAIMMYPKKVMEELEELIDNCNVVQRSMYQSDVPMHVKRFIRNHVIAFNDFLSCFVSDRIKEITWEHEWSDKMERDRDILEILFLNKRSFYPDHKKF